jgi:hypothetical protein
MKVAPFKLFGKNIFNLAKDYDLTIYISERYYSMLVIDIKKKWFHKILPFLISKKIKQFKQQIEMRMPINIHLIYEN